MLEMMYVLEIEILLQLQSFSLFFPIRLLHIRYCVYFYRQSLVVVVRYYYGEHRVGGNEAPDPRVII